MGARSRSLGEGRALALGVMVCAILRLSVHVGGSAIGLGVSCSLLVRHGNLQCRRSAWTMRLIKGVTKGCQKMLLQGRRITEVLMERGGGSKAERMDEARCHRKKNEAMSEHLATVNCSATECLCRIQWKGNKKE